jgi:hypothetical protein
VLLAALLGGLGALSLAGTLALLRFHPRFEITRVVMTGVPDARRPEAEQLTDPWIGQPLLFADVDGPVSQLARRSWVARVSARRVVPDAVVVEVAARPAVALARRGEALWSVDRSGTWLGPYEGRSLSAKDDFVVLDVPATEAGEAPSTGGGERAASPHVDPNVARGASFVERLAEDDPALLARTSEIAVREDGFRLVDQEARLTLVFGTDALVPGRASAAWRAFLALTPELERHGLLEREVDLRFQNRIVLRAPASEAGPGQT